MLVNLTESQFEGVDDSICAPLAPLRTNSLRSGRVSWSNADFGHTCHYNLLPAYSTATADALHLAPQYA
jgi:hypothetical protein